MYDIVLTSPDVSKQSATTPLWCRAELMHAAGSLHEFEPKLINVHKGEELVAQLPVYEQSVLGFTRLLPTHGSYYQGVHFYHPPDTSPTRNGLDELRISSELALFLKKHYKKFTINLAPSNYDMRGFTWNKVKVMPLYTYVHDFSSELMPLSNERRKLRSAAKEGYTFEERLDASTFIELSKKMYTRKQHHPVSDYGRFEAYVEDLHKVGLLKQYNVCRDGKIVSINILLQADAHGAYSLFRCSEKVEMDKGVSLWHTHMLVQTLKSRCQIMDLCGGNVPDIARFKAAMGLQLQQFFRISS